MEGCGIPGDDSDNGKPRRGVDEVELLASHARLRLDELKSEVQTISFSADVGDCSSIKLVELDEELLGQLRQGESLVFRGKKTDHAVLCTKDKTYAVKEAETSNSMLLLRHLTLPQTENQVDGDRRSIVPREVVGVHHTYFEVTPCRPRLSRVRHLLQLNVYAGREYESQNPSSMFTFENLLDSVQASQCELQTCLNDIEAYHINGFWRLLGFDYHCRVLTHILNLMEENSWNYKNISKRVIVDTLADLEPRTILEQCFDYYATVRIDDNGDSLYALDESKICRFFAQMMLKAAGKFNLRDFCEAWQQCIPEGMKADLKQLDGLALIDRSCRPEVICYFPVWELPDEVNQRFNVLFKTRSKWTVQDISPFVRSRDLATDKMDVNSLLNKHCRMFMANGTRCYTSKRPIL